MEKIKEIANFFNFSVHRKNSWLEKLKVYASNAQLQKLVVCRTRWLERIDGISIFEELFVSIYHSLREMKENKCYTLATRPLPKRTHCSSLLLTLVLLPH